MFILKCLLVLACIMKLKVVYLPLEDVLSVATADPTAETGTCGGSARAPAATEVGGRTPPGAPGTNEG